MYRRVNSDRFMVLTTAAIVVVMAVFTWVMWGMAQQVFTMTDVMVEMGADFHVMTSDIHVMAANIELMNDTIVEMEESIDEMADSIPVMSEAMARMTTSMERMTQDMGRATYAFTQPMSYMWGSPFPF